MSGPLEAYIMKELRQTILVRNTVIHYTQFQEARLEDSWLRVLSSWRVFRGRRLFQPDKDEEERKTRQCCPFIS